MRLRSPNFWIGMFSVSGLLGVSLALFGVFLGISWLRTVGLALIAPIVLVGVGIVTIGIPVLIIANRKHKE